MNVKSCFKYIFSLGFKALRTTEKLLDLREEGPETTVDHAD
jgi:hypothetical protein